MRCLLPLLVLAACAATAVADEGAFTKGPIFTDYGPVADVDVTMPIPPGTAFKHSFDVSTPAPTGDPNSTLVSVARFINMHARAGIPAGNIRAAVVVHGKAVKEMADELSASARLIAALTDQGVRIIVCGQSAAYYDVATDDLLPGVEMALSAMTAHAVLQQQGYTLNPF
jgi:intracellular sulfur oxidation DsrE/DsrF family protein